MSDRPGGDYTGVHETFQPLLGVMSDAVKRSQGRTVTVFQPLLGVMSDTIWCDRVNLII